MPREMINGFRMYYEVTGAGVPLLFVHGGLGGGRGSATFRQYQMTELAQYTQVIAFDRRAAGASETPAAGYSFDLFVADIIALLDHLGHQRAILMGTSGVLSPWLWIVNRHDLIPKHPRSRDAMRHQFDAGWARHRRHSKAFWQARDDSLRLPSWSLSHLFWQ